MRLASFEAIVRALNDAAVHYLVVGGLAVNAHGYLRFTIVVDVVVRLQPGDIHAAFGALAELGYRPSVPITAEQFATPELRERWRHEKGMLVLRFWSDAHPETPLDLFLYEPFDFAREEAAAFRDGIAGSPPAPYAAIPALIAMKRDAGRALDLVDIEKLEQLAELRRHDPGD